MDKKKPKEFYVGAKCKFCGEEVMIKEKEVTFNNKCPNCCNYIYEWWLTKAKR